MELNKIGFEDLNLDPELLKSLSTKYYDVESIVHRTVFLSYVFDQSVPKESAFLFLKKDLEALWEMEKGLAPAPEGFHILGHLVPPKWCNLEDPISSDLLAVNKKYAVFCYPTVFYREEGARYESEHFRECLKLGGVNSVREGEVGAEIVMEK